MSTEQVLEQARTALRSVRNNEMLVIVLAVLLGMGLMLAIMYINERWTFIPRKRQRKEFGESFAQVPGPRHGEKVIECGDEWTIM